MNIFKLDEYEYEFQEQATDGTSKAYVQFENRADPDIFDISYGVDNAELIHINGRYFKCLDIHYYNIDENRPGGTLKLTLVEEFRKRGVV